MAFQMPTWTTPFLEPSGMVSKPWYLFLTNLQNTVGGVLSVASGGTGVGSGTSGGILGFTSTTSLKSSVLLGANQIVLGGGAAATPTALGALGTTTQLLHGNAAGAPSFGALTAADISANLITNALLAQMATKTLKGNNTGGTANALDLTVAQVLVMLGIGSPITNSIAGDVPLNNTNNYFDGPSVAQGATGTWWASGTVTLVDTSVGVNQFFVKLWDGTTVIDSTVAEINGATNSQISCSVSGFLASPAGNIRISVRDTVAVSGLIKANLSGAGADSTVSAFRIA